MLLDRDRFAGEGGLVDLETAHLEEPQVRGHLVAGFEQHDVAGHELLGAARAACAPSRRTVAAVTTICASALIAFSARDSWT